MVAKKSSLFLLNWQSRRGGLRESKKKLGETGRSLEKREEARGGCGVKMLRNPRRAGFIMPPPPMVPPPPSSASAPSPSPLLARGTHTWTLAAGVAQEALGPILRAFPGLEALPEARVLKTNHFRTVYHVLTNADGGADGGTGKGIDGDVDGRIDQGLHHLAPGGLIAKVYRYTSRWDRLRYRVIPPRARQEWNALERFAALGLPTARAVGVAEERREGRLVGGGLLLTYLPDTVTLSERLAELHAAAAGADSSRRSVAPDAPLARETPKDRGTPEPEEAPGRDLLERAGRLVRALHDHGVWHRDLHAGNILVRRADEALFLIDLHTCVFQRRLWQWQRRGGLAKLLHSLRSGLAPAALRSLVAAYGADALGDGADEASVFKRLLEGVERVQARRVRSRTRRCFLPSSRFGLVRGRGWRLHHLRTWSPARLETLWRSEPPLGAWKVSPRGWVAPVQSAGVKVCVKHRRLSFLEGLRSLLEGHRLRRAYAGGHALWVRGIATPQVIAFLERRAFGLVREAFLATELAADAISLPALLEEELLGQAAIPRPLARQKRRLAREVGQLLRRLHTADLCLHDLSPQNILVRRDSWKAVGDGGALEPLVELCDLDHLYLWKRPSRARRAKNLAAAGNLPEGHVFVTDRLRALRAYWGGEEARLRESLPEIAGRLIDETRRVLERRWQAEMDRLGQGVGADSGVEGPG